MPEVVEMMKGGELGVSLAHLTHVSSIIPQRSFTFKYLWRIKAPVALLSEEFFQSSIKITAEADCVRYRAYRSMNGFISPW